MGERGHTAPTVTRATGLTYRQLDYWDRSGILHPSVVSANGSGSRRLYSAADVVKLCVLAAVLDSGVSHLALRRLSAEMEPETLAAADYAVLTESRLTLCDNATELAEALSAVDSVYATIINVGRIVSERFPEAAVVA